MTMVFPIFTSSDVLKMISDHWCRRLLLMATATICEPPRNCHEAHADDVGLFSFCRPHYKYDESSHEYEDS